MDWSRKSRALVALPIIGIGATADFFIAQGYLSSEAMMDHTVPTATISSLSATGTFTMPDLMSGEEICAVPEPMRRPAASDDRSSSA
jgi:hypothetical protein